VMWEIIFYVVVLFEIFKEFVIRQCSRTFLVYLFIR